jgi:rubredoxin
MNPKDVHLVRDMKDERPLCGVSLKDFLRTTDPRKYTCLHCGYYFARFGLK